MICRSKCNQDEQRVEKFYESVLQEIRTDIQKLISQYFWKFAKSFQLIPKGSEAKEKYCLGGKSTDLMGLEFAVCGIEMSGFVIRRTLQEIVLFDLLFLGSNC